ncbi:Endochitinase A [Smittium culicis]|uniref:Endochitinase A n=1 Tax=Smittium culicis TaxID=133412 RepID=A0A1R1YRM9_9FUNG|nr:Endochitinase A [Smittium culicis]
MKINHIFDNLSLIYATLCLINTCSSKSIDFFDAKNTHGLGSASSEYKGTYHNSKKISTDRIPKRKSSRPFIEVKKIKENYDNEKSSTNFKIRSLYQRHSLSRVDILGYDDTRNPNQDKKGESSTLSPNFIKPNSKIKASGKLSTPKEESINNSAKKRDTSDDVSGESEQASKLPSSIYGNVEKKIKYVKPKPAKTYPKPKPGIVSNSLIMARIPRIQFYRKNNLDYFYLQGNFVDDLNPQNFFSNYLEVIRDKNSNYGQDPSNYNVPHDIYDSYFEIGSTFGYSNPKYENGNQNPTIDETGISDNNVDIDIDTSSENSNQTSSSENGYSSEYVPDPGYLGLDINKVMIAVISAGFSSPKMNQVVFFLNCIKLAGISTRREAAMFLSQLLWESHGLKYKDELNCSESKCPNTYTTPIDVSGKSYFGRGYIQLTYATNYKDASMYLFGDIRLLLDPDTVSKNDQISWGVSYWYWKYRVHILPDVQQGLFGSSTRAINGALECSGGSNDVPKKRFDIYTKVLKVFEPSEVPNEQGCY